MMGFDYLKDVVSLELDPDRCIGCSLCARVCPHQVFAMEGKPPRAVIQDRDHCMECGACQRNCPAGAISVEVGEGCLRAVINELLGIEGPCC